MVLQVFADAGQVLHDGDAQLAKQRRRPDARQLQQLRRLNRTRAQQDLGAAARHFVGTRLSIAHTHGAPALDHQAGGLRFGRDAQIGALHRGPQIALCSAPAPALPGRELVVAGAFLAHAVEIFAARHADLAGAADEGFDQLILGPDVGHRERAIAAVESVRTALVALRLDEVGQHVVVAPTRVAQRGPMVVVLALAADVDQAVDRTRAAQGLAARPVDAAAVHVRIGVGVETPVVGRVPHRLAVADGQVDPERAVGWAGFQQEDTRCGVLTQSRGQYRTRGAGADHDVVEFVCHAAPSGHLSEVELSVPLMRS